MKKRKSYYDKDVSKNVRDLVEDVENEELSLDIPMQRRTVWTTKQKCLFIHSLLIQFVPYMIMIVSMNGIDYVIDGKQRLSTIIAFINNEFKITYDLEVTFIDNKKQSRRFPLKNKYFKDLPEELKKNLLTNSVFYVRYEDLDDAGMCELFNRLNNGTAMVAIDSTRIIFFKYNPHCLNLLTSICDEYSEFFRTFMSEPMINKYNNDIIQIIRAILIIKNNGFIDITTPTINREVINITEKDLNSIKTLIRRISKTKKINDTSDVGKNFCYVLAISLLVSEKNMTGFCEAVNNYFSKRNAKEIEETFNKYKRGTTTKDVVSYRYNLLKEIFADYIG